MASEEIACVIRGYHVYKRHWDPQEEDEFTVKHEPNNEHDRYAMAVLVVSNGSERVVGHLPREISRICCHFTLHGGIITGKVTGRRRRTPRESGGLEIPCIIRIFHPRRATIEKAKRLINTNYTD